ncbi:polysaccharide deacetylase family protein [Paenalcaligenes sp. Me131]|uniref:polysaccharide deacetylase family protein n=1 Tax=Paenalcaligenes sp. Me131 TaxID=3392636 RepID=UPI003D2AD4D1
MRKAFKLISAVTFALLSTASVAQTLSLTFDDGLNPDKQPQASTWNQAILDALKSADVTAMVFPALDRLGGEAGLALIRQWGEQGHAVGNHTSKHRSLASAQLSLDDFIADVVEADVVLNTLPNWTPMLRFPYLKEGDTVEKRDGIREWMRLHGYKAAPVSIDASDWYYNQVYSAWMDAGEPAKAQQVQEAYIEHLLDRAAYYDTLGTQVLEQRSAHVLLLHTNRINAETIPAVIQAFKQQGWSFVPPLQAFEDPLYVTGVESLPAGESIIWAHAKLKGVEGLRYPAEDSVYEEPRLEALGLLPLPTTE